MQTQTSPPHSHPVVPGEGTAWHFPFLEPQGPGSEFYFPRGYQQKCYQRGGWSRQDVPMGGISPSRRQDRLGVGETTGTFRTGAGQAKALLAP